MKSNSPLSHAGFQLLAAIGFIAIGSAADWLQFRNGSNSVTAEQELPVRWTETENIAWKVVLPGRGPAGPIVVGNRVFVTSASGVHQDRLHVNCYDTASGKQLWERQFWATGRVFTHPSISTAAPTAASDGKRIFAFFSTNDLICLDLDGNLQWFRGLAYDHPSAGNDVGMASSPAVIGETVIVQIENQGDSFATGLNTLTGETRWHVARLPVANWSSPIVYRGETRAEDAVLLQSPDHLTAHDPLTGREMWKFEAKCAGTPTASVADGIIYVPSGGITAIRPALGAKEPSVLWKASGLQPSSASPVVHAGRVYALSRAGVLGSADAATGEIVGRLRLKGAFWGTPAMVGNRLYCVSQDGGAQVVQIDPKAKAGEIVGEGTLGETLQSSPAVGDEAIYIRTDRHLWKIAQKK